MESTIRYMDDIVSYYVSYSENVVTTRYFKTLKEAEEIVKQLNLSEVSNVEITTCKQDQHPGGYHVDYLQSPNFPISGKIPMCNWFPTLQEAEKKAEELIKTGVEQVEISFGPIGQ